MQYLYASRIFIYLFFLTISLYTTSSTAAFIRTDYGSYIEHGKLISGSQQATSDIKLNMTPRANELQVIISSSTFSAEGLFIDLFLRSLYEKVAPLQLPPGIDLSHLAVTIGSLFTTPLLGGMFSMEVTSASVNGQVLQLTISDNNTDNNQEPVQITIEATSVTAYTTQLTLNAFQGATFHHQQIIEFTHTLTQYQRKRQLLRERPERRDYSPIRISSASGRKQTGTSTSAPKNSHSFQQSLKQDTNDYIVKTTILYLLPLVAHHSSWSSL